MLYLSLRRVSICINIQGFSVFKQHIAELPICCFPVELGYFYAAAVVVFLVRRLKRNPPPPWNVTSTEAEPPGRRF